VPPIVPIEMHDPIATHPASMPASGPRDGRDVLVVLALLCVVNVLSFLDRQGLSILAKPIQDGLGTSDRQRGRLR
jgi:hypothetical protein